MNTEMLWLAVGWSILVVVDAMAVIVIVRMISGEIDLSRLVSEPTGDASISRFQFLVFTYVVALTLFLVTLRRTPPTFPEISGGILSLLGISASTYAVSKGIQFSAAEGIEERPVTVTVTPSETTLKPGEMRTFVADVMRATDKAVTWSITPSTGSLDPSTGRYTAPPTIAAPTDVTVKATSVSDPSRNGTAVIHLTPA